MFNRFKRKQWAPWGGGQCPFSERTVVDVRLRNGKTYCNQTAHDLFGFASAAFWRHDGNPNDIVAYRVVK